MSLPSFLQPLESVLAGQHPSAPVAEKPFVAEQPSTLSLDVTDSTKQTGFGNFASLSSFLTNEALNAGLVNDNQPKGDKLKFMMVSTHAHQFTGYSKVSYGFLKELVKNPWLQLVHFGFQRNPQATQAHRPYPPSIKVYDAASLEKNVQGQPPNQGFGFTALPDVIKREKPNVVMIYNDMAVVSRFLEEIRKSGIPRNFKLWVYIDQVYNTQLQAYVDILNRDADRVFAFTPYWKKCIKSQGLNRPIDVLGHGFETDFFSPLPKNEIRKKMGIPENAFMILNLNRNQPRKRYDLLIMAFVELLVKYPTKPIVMMCVCDKGDKGGWWIFEIFQRELKLRGVSIDQFANRLLLTSQDMTFSDADINAFYNMADIGINTADGEGFGLCNFEQMGVGVPQVLPDIGGFKSFCTPENTMLVKPNSRYYLPTMYCPVGGEAEACDPHDFCLAIEEYLLNPSKREAHGKAARETVTKFTWEKATEFLVRRLKEAKEENDDE